MRDTELEEGPARVRPSGPLKGSSGSSSREPTDEAVAIFCPSDSLVSESPLWAPDSQTVVFRGWLQVGGESVWLFDQNEVREVGAPANPDTVTPSSWTEEGLLLTGFSRPVTGPDILLVNTETGETSEVLASVDAERRPDLSPDGRWLAYGKIVGDGTPEVVIRPFPETDSGGPWRTTFSAGP